MRKGIRINHLAFVTAEIYTSRQWMNTTWSTTKVSGSHAGNLDRRETGLGSPPPKIRAYGHTSPCRTRARTGQKCIIHPDARRPRRRLRPQKTRASKNDSRVRREYRPRHWTARTLRKLFG